MKLIAIDALGAIDIYNPKPLILTEEMGIEEVRASTSHVYNIVLSSLLG